MNQEKPLDHPDSRQVQRLYFALTNNCNRACPWCSTCSSPAGATFLSLEQYQEAFPKSGRFEVQLEGGEPTVHPQFREFIRIARQHPRVDRLVLCTNGATLPRGEESLRTWLGIFGPNFTLKLSVNHYLLDRDAGLITLAQTLHRIITQSGDSRMLVVNVRLRKGYENDDEQIRLAVERAGLLSVSNVFFLQKYGFASNEENWDEPFLAGQNFSMINPDGRNMGTDLVARSEAMRQLP
ncbi:MAG: radical SAM protein [Candidatus Obscuribacterales bacterium]|nr:radical SAM protein [Candidatus Obscuribacterales bacterium]